MHLKERSAKMREKIKISLQQNHPIALITAFKMSVAGIIGFMLVNHFHLPESVWCLVTIAAVLQAGLDQTLTKALMRVIGTLVGAVIGYWIALFTQADPILIMVLTFCVIFMTSYIAIQPTVYSYAGIVMGMTIAIIVFFGLAHGNVKAVAIDRTLEVLLGVGIVAVINLILFFCVKYFFPQGIVKTPTSWTLPEFKIKKQHVIAASKIASACVLTFLWWGYFKQPQGYWATISCLLIMEENQKVTLRKGLFRFASHFIAALLGFIFALALLHAPYLWRLIPLALTFFICGFLIGTKNKYAGMGNTLGIAIAIMLLASPNITETIHVIFVRFYNVMIGIAVAFLVLLI